MVCGIFFWLFSIGNGAENRSLEMGRKSPEVGLSQALQKVYCVAMYEGCYKRWPIHTVVDGLATQSYLLELLFWTVFCLFVCFCCFTSHVNSYSHCGTVSSLNHTFSWAGLSKRLTSNLCIYFRL